MSKLFISNSESETAKIAREVAGDLTTQSVLAIKGDLGSGKSFLCRNIIQHLLNKSVTVVSPTFNLLQTYDITDSLSIYHYDLYRLKSEYEAFELGVYEAFDRHITLIEWPEIISKMLPESTIFLNIEIIDEHTRKITIR
ncbi:MAG: hypothetical protein DGJ47_001184 [Rickettsiaceae bacterium]